MLTRLIVGSYEFLVELCLWCFILGGGGWGYFLGRFSGHGFLGFFLGVTFAFIIAVLVFGGFLLLSDIRKSIRTIEKAMGIPAAAAPAQADTSSAQAAQVDSAPIIARPPLPSTATHDEIMRHYNISHDGDAYIIGSYRFRDLDGALRHVRHTESLSRS